MSEKELEVFSVLSFLNSGYQLEDISEHGDFDIFSSAEECANYLIENDYLSNNGGSTSPQDISKNYTVAQLKEILRENNLKVSGKKQELVERVMSILSDKSEDLSLTDKAKEFLKENKWMDLYMFALVAFNFEDYENFHKNSSADDFNTALNFCDEILSRALIANQFIVFILYRAYCLHDSLAYCGLEIAVALALEFGGYLVCGLAGDGAHDADKVIDAVLALADAYSCFAVGNGALEFLHNGLGLVEDSDPCIYIFV